MSRAAGIGLAVAVGCGRAAAPVPDVLLITLDTTRADALGTYGASPSPSPIVDGLAARGVRGDEVMTVVPLTLPAHTSILTGLYPDRTGVRDNGMFVDDDLVTLPEVLAAHGWRTGGFVASMVLDGAYGLNQGFETYKDGFDLTSPGRPGDPLLEWPADVSTTRASTWLDEVDGAPGDPPFFAWVHYYDPHMPLLPPPRHRERFDDAYAAEIAFADDQIGALLGHVASLERERPLLVVVVGDHGEGRGDHGEGSHGLFVYRSTMRVPLVIVGAGVPAGVVVPGPVSVVDVAPTVLDLLGLPALEQADGVSLVPALGGGPLPERAFVYGETLHPRTHYGLAELRVVQGAEERFVLAPTPELFRWRDDPEEQADLAASHPADVSAWTDRLRAFEAGRRDLVVRGASGDPQLRAALAALGYVDGGAPVDDALPFDALPDPKTAPDIGTRLEALIVAARTRPPADAIPLIEGFLEEYPRVAAARQLLSVARELVGDPAGARAALDPMLAARPDDPVLLCRMAELWMQSGELSRARGLLERARRARQDYPIAATLLAEVERRQGRCDAALPLVERALALAPDSSRALLVRGACRHEARDPAAIDDLQRVLVLDPDNQDAPFLLGVSLARQGRAAEAIPLLEQQVARTPDRNLARAALGLALYADRRYAEAITELERCTDDPEVGAEPPILLADALLRAQGPSARIEALLDLGAARDPGDPRLARVRSALFMARGQVDAALRVLEPGLERQ